MYVLCAEIVDEAVHGQSQRHTNAGCLVDKRGTDCYNGGAAGKYPLNRRRRLLGCDVGSTMLSGVGFRVHALRSGGAGRWGPR